MATITEYETIDILLADLLNNLAACNEVLGNFETSRDFYEESLNLRKIVFGDKHVKVAESMQNLATILDVLNHHNEAEQLLENALSIERELYGDDSVEAAITLNNLGVLCVHMMGKLAKAQNLFETSVAIRSRAYGDQHHYTMCAKQNLKYVINKRKETGELINEEKGQWV